MSDRTAPAARPRAGLRHSAIDRILPGNVRRARQGRRYPVIPGRRPSFARPALPPAHRDLPGSRPPGRRALEVGVAARRPVARPAARARRRSRRRATTALAARLFDPAVLTAILVVEARVLGWRLFAVGATRRRHADPADGRDPRRARRSRSRSSSGPQLVVAGADGRRARRGDRGVRAGRRGRRLGARPGPRRRSASNDPDFARRPAAVARPSGDPSARPSRLAPGHARRPARQRAADRHGLRRRPDHTLLTDTMIVVSLDPVGKTVSMASIPRDMVDVPLPDGRKYRGKINGLVSYVRWHPGKFPGAKDGQSVLAAALGTLLGIKIDYWAQVNLGGFVYARRRGRRRQHQRHRRLLRLPLQGVRDQGLQHHARPLPLGRRGGARVRADPQGAGRERLHAAGRQQEVIAALRDRIVRGEFLDNPSRFLRASARRSRPTSSRR